MTITNKHTLTELKQMQSLSLESKVQMTRQRIKGWVNEYGEDGVYISFSGGKDSTVLLDIVRKDYPSIPAVFVDTGLEYPEIREFVKTFNNVIWLKPKMNFKQVIEKYGYPFFSKEISESLSNSRRYFKRLKEGKANDKQIPIRVQQVLGTLKNKDGKNKSLFDKSKYRFMLYAPFEVSNRCCYVMKKNPVHKYGEETGRKPMTAQMASESKKRAQKWMQNGCNGFNMKSPISNPMAFWTEQDVLFYIKENNIPICSVYGDIVEDKSQLKTTGCNRTGCMFCGYGCHLEKRGEGRFELMKKTHPKQYEWIMKSWNEGGLGYKEIIDWINKNSEDKVHIRY